MKRVPIIIINGGPGVGKSTLAQALSKKFDIRQRSDTYAILSAFRSIVPNHPALKSTRALVLSSDGDIKKHIYKRSKLISPAVNRIIERNSGRTPYVLDGMYILKRYLTKKYRYLFVTISAPPEIIYEQWLHEPNTKTRTFFFPFSLAKKINQILLKEARAAKTLIIRDPSLRKRVHAVERALAQLK